MYHHIFIWCIFLYMYISPHIILKKIYADWYVHACIYMKCLYVENVYTGILLSVKLCASEYVVYVKCNFFWVNIVQV